MLHLAAMHSTTALNAPASTELHTNETPSLAPGARWWANYLGSHRALKPRGIFWDDPPRITAKSVFFGRF